MKFIVTVVEKVTVRRSKVFEATDVDHATQQAEEDTWDDEHGWAQESHDHDETYVDFVAEAQ